jgi:hypothetical protein
MLRGRSFLGGTPPSTGDTANEKALIAAPPEDVGLVADQVTSLPDAWRAVGPAWTRITSPRGGRVASRVNREVWCTMMAATSLPGRSTSSSVLRKAGRCASWPENPSSTYSRATSDPWALA